MATTHLVKMGHKNIAFIGGSPSSGSRAQRIGGFTSTLLEHGISPNPEWIVATQASQIDGAKAAESLLLRFPQITAAVCYRDIVALGVMQALRKMGRELGVILRCWGSTTSLKRRWFNLRSPPCRWRQKR